MSTGTSCHFGHLLQVVKKISLKSDFMQFFQDFIHVYIPGDKVLMSFHSFDASFKKMPLKSDFFRILYMYIFQGTKF